MNFTGLSATAIWASPVRNLTSFGLNTLASVAINNHVALANGVNVDLRPSAGKFRHSTIMGEPLANVTWTIQSFDGTTARNIVSGGSGAGFIQTGPAVQAMGFALLNSGTVSGNFNHTGFDLVQ